MSPLTRAFEAHLPRECAAVRASEADLAAFVERGRAAWPMLAVDPQAFVGYVAQRFGPDQSLDQTSADGLYLACACVGGDQHAVATFHDAYRSVMEAVYRRLGFQRLAEEISQRVLRQIFVSDETRGPGLLGYNGRGSLANWVRVLTVREAYRATRQQKKRMEREVGGVDDRIMDRAVGEEQNPELLHLKRDYRQKFKQSFQLAFSRLSHRERNILRYQYLDGLNLEQIGAIYAASRATVARWRAAARARLLAETRKIMRDEFRVPLEEFDGAIRLIESAMDVSLSRLLTAVAADEDDDE
jgi:RNA polymerase sigma-70 factor, ECF subfamily